MINFLKHKLSFEICEKFSLDWNLSENNYKLIVLCFRFKNIL
jgi:hypothetical protein